MIPTNKFFLFYRFKPHDCRSTLRSILRSALRSILRSTVTARPLAIPHVVDFVAFLVTSLQRTQKYASDCSSLAHRQPLSKVSSKVLAFTSLQTKFIGGKPLRSTLIPLLSFLLFVACGDGLENENQENSPKVTLSESKVTLSESLEDISMANAQNYLLRGRCDASLESLVNITVGEPNITLQLDCLSGGNFIGIIDIRTVMSIPQQLPLVRSALPR